MLYCSQCGFKVEENAKCCAQCGNKLAPVQQSQPEPQPQPAPQPQPQQQSLQQVTTNNAVQWDKKFERVTLRYRCPHGHVFDAYMERDTCEECGAPLEKGGVIQMYRMGNYMGMAVGMGIYIDGEPYGHISNRESLRIRVPYGTHLVHVTHTTTRACNDPMLTVTPENPYVWCKASFTKMGFKIEVLPASPESMPLE